MKFRLWIILSFLCTFSVHASNSFTIWSKDGNQQIFIFAENPVITFTKEDLVVTTHNAEVHFSITNLLRYEFSDTNITSIENSTNLSAPFEMCKDYIYFPALKPFSHIQMYSLNGNLLFSHHTSTESTYTFPIHSLQPGIFILKVNGLTFKLLIQ